MAADLTILVPVYNEARTLKTIMERIVHDCPNAEVVYIDDGSADESLQILKANARPTDKVITKPNGGKGTAIREGLTHAAGAYTVIQDADLEYDPVEIHMLLAEAKAFPGCAVFGSRFRKQNPNIYRRYLMGNKVLTGILNMLYGSDLTDSYTCYKLLPTDVFRSLPLTANGFELEAEITCMCLRRKVAIREVSISYHPRTLEEGKKIGWRDAWKGLATMLRLRFS